MLQIGAFDGTTNDPIARSINAFGWEAVLVEPQLHPILTLQRLYKEHPDVQTFNVAISDQDGTRPLFTIDPVDDLPGWVQGIASFNRGHFRQVQRHLPGIDLAARMKVTEVPSWTFDTLLRHADIGHVDVLQIDTEGYDLELLRMFDVPRRKPRIIGYEHKHLSRADRAAAAELLVACGYRLAMVYGAGDTVAVAAPDT